MANGEQFLRMQFLYQAAQLLVEEGGTDNAGTLINSRHYVSEAKNIAKRHVLRIDPAIKHKYCKRCCSATFEEPSSDQFRKLSKK